MGNLFCCVYVDQSTVAIKETFGKFEEVLEPGCHFLPWCHGGQIAGYLSLSLQQLDITCETKTKDDKFVNVVASVQYRALANKANDAFYNISNTKSQIQACVFDVIRASVPKLLLDDVFEQKNEIAKALEEELEKAISGYGFEIVQTLIVDFESDEHVKANENAEAEKILLIKRAEAESKYHSDRIRADMFRLHCSIVERNTKDVMDMMQATAIRTALLQASFANQF